MSNDTEPKKYKYGETTARYWLWTWNNYTESNLKHLRELSPEDVREIEWGFEIGEKGTPHLQGWIYLKNSLRSTGVKKILDPVLGLKSPVHVGDEKGKPSCSKLKTKARAYCKKGEQSKAEWLELETKGPNYGKNAKVESYQLVKPRCGQGSRTDWIELREFIYDNPDFEKVAEEFPEYAVKYHAGIKAIIQCAIQKKNMDTITKEFEKVKLFNWQQELYKELENKPHDRKIIWYVDTLGNCGKSTMSNYLKIKMDALGVGNCKTSDIAHAYNGQKVVCFDFVRSMEDKINYGVIESIKNGRIFSPKYESVDKIFSKPWVVVFANFEPQKGAMSLDRWDIRYINKDSNDCKIYIPPSEPTTSSIDTNTEITATENKKKTKSVAESVAIHPGNTKKGLGENNKMFDECININDFIKYDKGSLVSPNNKKDTIYEISTIKNYIKKKDKKKKQVETKKTL